MMAAQPLEKQASKMKVDRCHNIGGRLGHNIRIVRKVDMLLPHTDHMSQTPSICTYQNKNNTQNLRSKWRN